MPLGVKSRVLSTVALSSLLAGCGGIADGAHSPSQGASSQISGSAAPGPEELSYEDAREKDLLLEDVVRLASLPEVRGAGVPRRVDVAVLLQSRPVRNRLDVVWSGDCDITKGAKRQILDLKPAQKAAIVTVHARLRPRLDMCSLRIDVSVLSEPPTGSGLVVTLRR